MNQLIRNTDFIDLPVHAQGKVRSIYDLGETLVIVVTDRISAFDVVFDELIPDKGIVLNSISAFWFQTHIICAAFSSSVMRASRSATRSCAGAAGS